MQVVENLREIIYEPVTDEYGWGKYGEFRVLIRKSDGYVNATKLCGDGKKELYNWMANEASKRLVSELESVLKISRTVLIQTLKGGKIPIVTGSYVHQDLIPHIASWISPKFAVFISKIIREWRAASPSNERKFWVEMGDCVTNYPFECDQEEKRWQALVAAREQGEMEVETRCGRIDVLTASKVIEIKRALNWKHALGQVLCYGREFKDRKIAIYLFDWSTAPRDVIGDICTHLGVEVHYLE